MMGYLLLLAAALQWALFELGQSLPIALSLALILLAAADVVRRFLRGSTGLLGAYGFLVLMIPFVHLIPYLWFDFGVATPQIMWGLGANEYMWDAKVAALLSMMGSTAACAYAAGLAWLGRFQRVAGPTRPRERPMSHTPIALPVFLVLAFAALGFAWISAPQETVFAAAYTHSEALSQSINFSSAGFLGYVTLLFLLADVLLDEHRLRRGLKIVALACATLVVIVWLQLARGDRESLTFVVAGFALVYFWCDLARYDRPGVRFSRLHKPTLLLAGSSLYVIYYAVGILRSGLEGTASLDDFAYTVVSTFDVGGISIDNFLVGTWTGAIMSPVSVAGDYVTGHMPLRLGATYVDIVLSIPPGFVADWLGYERPIDATRGPAFEMVYGIGGTHAVVVPFMNFGLGGIVGFMLLWAALLNALDRAVVRRPGYYRFCLCAAVLGVLPHWFWYGEKNIINVLILWVGLSVALWAAERVSDAFRPA